MNEAVDVAAKKKNKGGRPCKYESHVKPRLNEIETWIREGLTDYCIADNLGIAHYTLIRYREQFNELSEVYTRAQVKQVQKVVNAVFKRALGYDYEEQVLENFDVKDEKGNIIGQELRPTKVITKHVPGDVNAQRFYLVNRDPENWRPEKMVEINNNINNNISLEEARRKAEQLLAEREKLKAIDIAAYEIVEAE